MSSRSFSRTASGASLLDGGSTTHPKAAHGFSKQGSREFSSGLQVSMRDPIKEITVITSESSQALSGRDSMHEWTSSQEGSRENIFGNSTLTSNRDSSHRDHLALPMNAGAFARTPSATPRSPRGPRNGTAFGLSSDELRRVPPRALSFSLSAAIGTPMSEWIVPVSEEPDIPAIAPINHVENHPSGTRFVLLHGGAGVFRYPSGSPCVVMSVCHLGVSAAIWEDAPSPALLATYNPATMLTCYHPNATCRFSSNATGYSMFDLDGTETTAEWDSARTLALQLAPDVRVRSVGRAELELVLAFRALPARILLTARPPTVAAPAPAARPTSQPATPSLVRASFSVTPIASTTIFVAATATPSALPPSLPLPAIAAPAAPAPLTAPPTPAASAHHTSTAQAHTGPRESASGPAGSGGDATLVFDPGTASLLLPVDDPLLDRIRSRASTLVELINKEIVIESSVMVVYVPTPVLTQLFTPTHPPTHPPIHPPTHTPPTTKPSPHPHALAPTHTCMHAEPSLPLTRCDQPPTSPQRRLTCFSSPTIASVIRSSRAVRSAPARAMSPFLSSPPPRREGPDIVCPTRMAFAAGAGRMRACLCDARRIPTLPAALARRFLERCFEQSPEQFILVYVAGPDDNPMERVLLTHYSHQHACRAQPCAHATVDALRIVRAAGEGSTPCVGRLLIYYQMRLVFSDTRLDGRGFTQSDFGNQLARTRRDARQGLALPAKYGIVAE
eukprot:m.108883 g.108883  ORF g.108883 m.108883 type:complete len:732 (+) comp14292_c0_seq4:493-2688(+)